MLLFIKPSFVNELNEGEGGPLTLASHRPRLSSPSFVPDFQPSPSFRATISLVTFVATNSKDASDFFSTGLSAKFPSRLENGAFMQDVSESSV